MSGPYDLGRIVDRAEHRSHRGPSSLEVQMRIGTLLTISIVVGTVPARGDEPAKSEGEHHWGYTSGTTPSHWGEVSPTCASGTHQSPIALSKQQAKAHDPLRPLEFSW